MKFLTITVIKNNKKDLFNYLQIFILAIGLIGFGQKSFSQICGTCTTPNCSITDNTTATNGIITVFNDCYTLPTPAISGTISNCYTISTNGTGKLGFRLSEDIRQNQSSGSNCGNSDLDAIDASRTYTLKLASSGCGGATIAPSATNVNNSATLFNPEWYSLLPNTAYVLCVTITLPNDYCQFEKICMVGYHLTGTPVASCSSTVGTVAVSGAVPNGPEYDLSPGTQLSLVASGYTLPSNGGASPCIATYGYAIYDQAPTLPLTIASFSSLPGFRGISTGITCTDNNNGGLSSSISNPTANKLWFVALTADCKNGSGTPLDVDSNGDLCYDFGTTAIVVNYITSSPCGSCTNPVCPIYLSPSPSASPSSTYPTSNHITESALGPATVTECHTVTVVNSNQTLGFRQSIYQANNGCATKTYTLYATDISGHCTGLAIAPTRAMGTYSTIFNPEWDYLPAGNYVMCITQTLDASCDIDYINTGYYLLPLPPCPSAPSTSPVAYCQNEQTSALSVTPTPGCALKWYDVATGGTVLNLTPTPSSINSGTTTYYVSQIDNTTSCESPRASIVVTVNPTPILTIHNPGNVCAPTNVNITLPEITSGSTIGSSLTYWIDNNATLPLTVASTISNSGTYYIKSTVSGCSIVAPVTVMIDNCNCPMTVTTHNPSPVCSPLTVDLTLPAVTTGSIGGGTFTYFTDVLCTQAIVDPTAIATIGTTTLYIKGDNGVCTDIKPVDVTINPSPTLVISSPAAVCSPQIVNITVPAITDGSTVGGILSYWNDTLAQSLFTNSTAISISNKYFIKSTLGNCSAVQPVIVTINPLPSPPITSPVSYCLNAGVSPLSATASSGNALNWYGNNAIGGVSSINAPIPSTSIVGASTYYVSQTNILTTCESSRSSLVVTINTNPIISVSPVTICNGEMATLIATGGSIYSWGQGATNNPYNVFPGATTTYSLTGIDANLCIGTTTVTVTVKPIPAIAFVDSLTICSPDKIDITNISRSLGSSQGSVFSYYTDFLLNSTLTNPSEIEFGGVYFIQGDLNGCKSKVDSVVVTINNKPTAAFTPTPSSISTINAISKMVNGTSNAVDYSWDFGDGTFSTLESPEHEYQSKDTATFTVKLIATSQNGCIDSIKNTVKIFEPIIYYIPNSFTPDGDQYNQEFKPIFNSGYDEKGYSLMIFNRWGQIVFETTDINKGWNGIKMNSTEKAQNGTYTWKVYYSLKGDDKRININGIINLFR